MTAKRVLFRVLIQDADVVTDPSLRMAAVHPVAGSASSGFWDGPACARVAVVDVDADTGKLRPGAQLQANPGLYRDTWEYEVGAPAGAVLPLWDRMRRQDAIDLELLRTRERASNPFIKVSAFGTVIRTLGFVESPGGIGHRVRWAFDGDQLLVVPVAGEMDNAYYHRDAHSLLFYFFAPEGEHSRVVYSALSQDIVAHEATHAIVDGVAPDLYHAVTPDSLAVHEAVADMTAALVSMVNRELIRGSDVDRLEQLTREMAQGSSRYSRIAEEFGRWRGHSAALRDLNNTRTLNPRRKSQAQQVDVASPHSLSEVLSGALFDVLLKSFQQVLTSGSPLVGRRQDTLRDRVLIPLTVRIGSLIYKGLDWLPPGDVSLADYVRSMLIADAFHHPTLDGERQALIETCTHRAIAPAERLATPVDELSDGLGEDVDLTRLATTPRAAKDFVRRHRARFGVPPDTAFTTRTVPVHRLDADLRRWLGRGDTIVDLDGHHGPADEPSLLVVKAGWRINEPQQLPGGHGAVREVMIGSSVVIAHDGTVHAIIRGASMRGCGSAAIASLPAWPIAVSCSPHARRSAQTAARWMATSAPRSPMAAPASTAACMPYISWTTCREGADRHRLQHRLRGCTPGRDPRP
jgi:hypothetical protein